MTDSDSTGEDPGPRPSPGARLWRWLDSELETTLCFLFYVYLTAIIVIEVVRRYLFDSSTTYAEETARYAFIWLTYIACARGVKRRAHLSIDILSSQFGRTGRFGVYMLSDACFLVLAGVVVMTSIQMVQNNIQFYQTFTGLDAPMWLATVAVPVGWTLIGLRVIQRSLKTIRVYRRGGSMDPGHLMAG